MRQMLEISNKILEAAAITLKPGQSKLYKSDGTLYYKLTKLSAWDASDAISDLTNILKKGK
jgi:hypothetical protein